MITFIDRHLNKPEYLFQPLRIIKRFGFRPSASARMRLRNGISITVNTNEDIGRSIATLGVYDLVVSEAITRLLDSGEAAVDAGANVGYMSAIMAGRVAPNGRIVCFEPNPLVGELLRENSRQWRVSVDVQPRALSARNGSATLYVPDKFDTNQGIASLEARAGKTVEVETVSLDEYLDGTVVGLLKIDIEGHEYEALSGAARLLKQHQIRDIIFEDHAGYPSAVSQMLEADGYQIFRLSRSLLRPLLLAGTIAVILLRPFYPIIWRPSTRRRSKERFRPVGWRCLSKGR